MNEIIKKLQEVKDLKEKTALDLEKNFNLYADTKDKTLVESLDQKIKLFQKLELELKDLEEKAGSVEQ